ncbi:MAG: spermidine synthase [Planctomycetota bacterium]|jgi:spermidine synthase
MRLESNHAAGLLGPCLAVVALAAGGDRGGTLAADRIDAAPHRSLHATDSLYGTLEVTEAGGIRYLFVDGVLQTAMYADPHAVARECHLFDKRYWLELLPYFRPEGRRCLLIGLGGGLLPAVLAGYGVQTRAVEIDAKVLEAARKHFGYRQAATVGDGRDFLSRDPGRYDFIVIDAFAGAEFPYRLGSKECFELAESRLEDSGVLAVNLISKPTGSRVSASVVATLKAVFPHVAVFRTDSPERVQSLICFAAREPLEPALHPHGKELGVTTRRLAEVAEFEVTGSWPEGPVLTDGENPLDREWLEEARRWRGRITRLFGRGSPTDEEERDDAKPGPILRGGVSGAPDDRLPIRHGRF